ADLVKLVKSYQYDDKKTGGEDVLVRDPYILQFSFPNSVLKDLVMIPVHTKPDDAEKELDELYDVFLHIQKEWKTNVRNQTRQRHFSTSKGEGAGRDGGAGVERATHVRRP
ncbi:hypothetical protein ILYODFUR_032328, partial [Ilyodon furcidens]